MKFYLHQKKFIAAFVLTVLLTLFLQACADTPGFGWTPPTATPPTPTPTARITSVSPQVTVIQDVARTRWLQSIPCKAPCFEGITPGVTSVDEAVAILKNSPYVDAGSVEIKDYTASEPKQRLVYWSWKTAPLPFNSAIADFDDPKHTIRKIHPNMEGINFSLAELMQLFGEPSHVSADNVYTSNVRLYWADVGIYSWVARKQANFDILPATPMRYIRFFAPDALKEAMQSPLQPITKWEGFKGFKYYCLLGHAKESC